MLYAAAILGTALLGWGLFELFDDDDTSDNTSPEQDFDSVQQGDDTPNTLTGTEGDDLFAGAGGDDALSGDSGDDSLAGASGDDTLSGGADNDTLAGGLGADVLLGQSGNDLIDGDFGKDTIDGGAGDDVIDAGGQPDAVLGGEGNDLIRGGDAGDVLSGRAGDDNVEGEGGDDLLFGEQGADTLEGGAGDDALVAVDALSRDLTLQDLQESLATGDTASGLDFSLDDETSGADTLFGGAGQDLIAFGAQDVAYGGADDDTFLLYDSHFDGSATATIADYNNNGAGEEIIIIYDATGGTPAPTVTTEQDGAHTRILLDGVHAVTVQNVSYPTVRDAITLVASA